MAELPPDARVVLKPLPSSHEQLRLQSPDAREIYVIVCQSGSGSFRSPQQSISHQQRRTDQVRRTRKRGQALVGRLAISKWQQLPPRLLRARQRVDPFVRGGAKVTDAIRPRQAADMQQ